MVVRLAVDLVREAPEHAVAVSGDDLDLAPERVELRCESPLLVGLVVALPGLLPLELLPGESLVALGLGGGLLLRLLDLRLDLAALRHCVLLPQHTLLSQCTNHHTTQKKKCPITCKLLRTFPKSKRYHGVTVSSRWFSNLTFPFAQLFGISLLSRHFFLVLWAHTHTHIMSVPFTAATPHSGGHVAYSPTGSLLAVAVGQRLYIRDPLSLEVKAVMNGESGRKGVAV